MLKEVSDKSARTQFPTQGLEARDKPQHGPRRIFKEAGNIEPNSKLNDAATEAHGGIALLDLLSINKTQTRKTVQIGVVTKGTPRGSNRAVPCAAPSSAKCGKPNSPHAATFNPTSNDIKHLGVPKIKVLVNAGIN